MKYLKSIIVCAFIISFSMVSAQKNQTKENSVLWKIEHKDLEKPSYLLGTLHLMCAEDFKLTDKVVHVLEKTEALVLEVNMSDPEEMKAIQAMMGEQKKISEELSEKEFNELDKLVTSITQTPLKNFDSYGLTGVQFFLINKMLPCSDVKYMEMELQKVATKNGITIGALEKVAEQMNYVKKGFTTAFTYKQLMLFESYKKDFNAAIEAYVKEDIDTATDLITKEDYMDANAKKYVQIIRNKNWVAKMPKMMADNSNVFAVGTAHLVGEEGIIDLLREKGYTVSPVLK